MTYDPLPAFERLEAAFEARDMDGLVALWAEDIDYRSPGGSFIGREQRIAAERIWLDGFPDASIERTRQLVSGNIVILEGVMRGTHTGPLVTQQGIVPPTGRAMSGQYVSLMTFVDDQITHQRVYFDQLALMAQLGLSQDGAQ